MLLSLGAAIACMARLWPRGVGIGFVVLRCRRQVVDAPESSYLTHFQLGGEGVHDLPYAIYAKLNAFHIGREQTPCKRRSIVLAKDVQCILLWHLSGCLSNTSYGITGPADDHAQCNSGKAMLARSLMTPRGSGRAPLSLKLL